MSNGSFFPISTTSYLWNQLLKPKVNWSVYLLLTQVLATVKFDKMRDSLILDTLSERMAHVISRKHKIHLVPTFLSKAMDGWSLAFKRL